MKISLIAIRAQSDVEFAFIKKKEKECPTHKKWLCHNYYF